MIITCPNCGTHYDIKPGAIKPTGSMMRCTRCGYVWQQSVVHAIEVREQQVSIPTPVAQHPAPQPTPEPAPPPPPPPPAPEPEPMPAPEPEPEPEPAPEPAPEPVEEPAEEPLSQDELDDLFGPDDAPGDGLESMIDSNIDDDEAETITLDDDDGGEEQDAIPDSLTEPLQFDDDKDDVPKRNPRFKIQAEKKTSPLKIIAIAFAVVFIGSALTIFLAKDTIIDKLPFTKELYIQAGLYTPEVGEGLTHSDVTPRRDVRNGVDYLIIEGKVENITDEALPVPLLKVALTNADGREIRVITHELAKTQLDAGEVIPFEVEFENPPGTARSMSLGFVEHGADGDAPQQ